MKKLFALRKLTYPLLLLLVVIMLFSTNYEPGTYLLGWDSLQTELAPALAVKRALHAGWQEYQSFGLTSGMAHAADLVRAVFLWIVSFVLPQSMIRYFFHFLMVYIGGVGLFFLLRYMGFRKDKQVLAFAGAAFYMLNLGTMQIMSLPFEPFSTFFGFLPWEIYVFLRFAYADNVKPKHLLALIIVNILATPQAYLQTLFVVYILCLGFFAFGMLLENYSRRLVRRFIVAFGLIIAVNLFWILPQFYFIQSSVSVVKESKINQIATDIVNRQNHEKGTIRDFARLEGFYYDLHDTQNNLIFKPWHTHYSNFFVNVLSYLPFVILLVGVFKRFRSHFGFISIFVMVSLMLLSNTVALSYVNSLIFSHSFINQIFRSPFTKFIIPYSLVYSYLFASGLDIIYTKFIDYEKGEKTLEAIIFTSSIILLIVIYSLPAFLGNYFSSEARVKIPDSYLQLVDYFEEQDPNKRIALLPDYTFWGWFSNDWGYDGSGFLWYGLRQPVVSRTFDVWSYNSESYFWEVKNAIESIDTEKFEDVMEKYNIDYLIVEKNLNAVSSVHEGLQYDQLAKIFEKSKKVKYVKGFEELDLYKVTKDKNVNNYISISRNMPSVSPVVSVTNSDQAFTDLKTYKALSQPDYIYPFMSLMTQKNISNKNWEITETENSFVLKAYLGNINIENYSLDENNTSLEAAVFLGEDIQRYDYNISTSVVDDILYVTIAKEFVEKFDPTYVEVNNCRGIGDFGIIKRGATLSVESEERGLACFGYSSVLMDHWNGYLIKVDSENILGNNLFFYIFGNRTRKQSKLETNLKGGTEYFLLNPGYFYDDGYFLSFQNTSYESLKSENKLNLLETYLFPFEYIKN
ncbi:hypothetical protein ACFL0C_00185, partial [Patescibacteria group bacterium]